MFDLRDVVVWCSGISIIITTVYLLRQRVFRPMSKWFQREFGEAVRDTIQPDLEIIKHELTANQGGSLKDLVKSNHEETLQLTDEADLRMTLVESQYPEIMEKLDLVIAKLNPPNQGD